MTLEELKKLISGKYKDRDLICTSPNGRNLLFSSLSFTPKNGSLRNRECLRFWVPEGVGRNRSVAYDELLQVVNFYDKHRVFPSPADMRHALRDSIGNSGASLTVVKAIVPQVVPSQRRRRS